MTEAMAKRVAIGNAMAQWLAEPVRKFCLAGPLLDRKPCRKLATTSMGGLTSRVWITELFN